MDNKNGYIRVICDTQESIIECNNILVKFSDLLTVVVKNIFLKFSELVEINKAPAVFFPSVSRSLPDLQDVLLLLSLVATLIDV